MKIVFNTKSMLNTHQQDKYFLHETLKRMIKKYKEHEFIVMADHAYENLFSSGNNTTKIITHQPASHPLLRKLWFDFKLPAILKKYKADVFVSCDGFCSLTTSLPQCLLLPDLPYFYNPSVLKRAHQFFYKQYLPKYLLKAKTIVTVSASFKKELSLRYKIAEDKIDVIYAAANEAFHPIEENAKEETRRKYADGKSYFICTQRICSRKSLMNLLKAFSVFKKRQKSNWKLVFTGSIGKEGKLFTESLETYKYREDIVLTADVKEEEMIKLIGAAYALIHSNEGGGICMPVLDAMKCHIPVITSADPVTEEIAGDAVLYANTRDYIDIAEKMMVLYKDETFRINLVEKAQIVIAKYNWDKTVDALWKSIQKAYTSAGKTQL